MAQTSRSQKNAQRQQSVNVAVELHSRVVPRQSILTVTEKTSDGTRRTPGIRRVSVATKERLSRVSLAQPMVELLVTVHGI